MDKSKYPYFARTFPSDNYQVTTLIHLAVKMNVTTVSVLYSGDTYSYNLARNFILRFQSDVNPEGVLLDSMFEKVDADGVAIPVSYQKLIESILSAGAPGVVLITSDTHAYNLFTTANSFPLYIERQQDYLWFGSDWWTGYDYVLKEAPLGCTYWPKYWPKQ